MRKQLRNLVLAAMAVFCQNYASAGAKNTPMEAFIAREHQMHSFEPVAGMWENSAGFPVSATEPYVRNAMVLDIDMNKLARLMQEKNTGITLSVPKTGGGFYELELARFDFFSAGFQLQENGANGAIKMVDYTPGLYYRGIVKGVEHSVAVFSFFNDKVYGIFSMPDAGNYVLVPNTLNGAAPDNYLFYNDLDLKIKPQGDCATDKLPSVEGMKEKAARKGVFSTCKDVEVYFKADFETFNTFNQSTTQLANYITSIFNVTSTLYRNEGIYVSIRYMEVNTAMDNYQFLPSSSHDYLFEFANEVTTLHGADMGMLLSTMHGSGMGGVAILDQLCFGTPLSFSNITNLPVGSFPTYSWNGHMVTHEFGHTLGSPHTHSCDWNGNFTAIDACVPIQGGCPNPVPAIPSGGGTIMSYCHFVQAGVNFSKGFGTQPGDLIRSTVFNAPCAEMRFVKSPTSDASKTVVATRECTDENDVTWYWNDNNSTIEDDDMLALKIRKAGANIGNIDITGFDVRSVTHAGYNQGSGLMVQMPAGTVFNGSNVAMQRYWKVTPTQAFTNGEMEIMFPFTKNDINDIDGSVPNTGSLLATELKVYTTTNGVDPNPSGAMSSANPADISAYPNGSFATGSTWSVETYGDTILAHFNIKNLVTSGGGSMVYSYSQNPGSVQGIYEEGKAIFYPNPTNSNWNVYVPNTGNEISMSLYAADGRVVATQQLQGGTVNEVKATALPAGLYYYRISSETATFTGSLKKQ